jgi:hypothetical protein
MRASACCSWAVCRPSEQDLDHPDIGVLLQQMRRKAVKRVRGHVLVDLGHVGRGMAGAPELARRHRVDRVHSGKQPLDEAHLRRILKTYARYYNETRTHLALDKDAPVSRPVQRTGVVRSLAILGGLHHHYGRA